MNQRILIISFLLLSHAGFSEARPGAAYKEGSGILLSDETQAAIGLKMVDVEDRSIIDEATLTAQVYETLQDDADKNSNALASAVVSSAKTKDYQSGQVIRIISPASLTGKIVRIDNTMAASTQRAELIIEIPDPGRQLKIGDFVNAVLTGSTIENTTVIPESAVLRSIFGNFAYVSNGYALLRTPIETGAGQDGYVEVVDGLFSGDEVAAHAVETLYQIELRATKGGGHCH